MGAKQDIVDRLFTGHPRTLGMSWFDHGIRAVKIGGTMIGSGVACLVHAVIPGLFTETAGRTVVRLHDHMQQRRAGAANPNSWPDYEI